MSEGAIHTERRDPATAWITIDNPNRMNAMSMQMWRSLESALTDVLADPALRVIVLRGAGGKAFVSGADISEFPDHRNSSEIARLYDAVAGRALNKLRNAPVPVIAQIEGYCIGGGVLIALACDLRYASRKAVFSIPAARVGLGYDWPATKDLIDAIGGPAAKEMLYTAVSYSAEEALTLGLLNRVVAPDALAPLVVDMVERIKTNAPLTIRAAKGIAAELMKPSSVADLARCDQLTAACSDSADYREGYAAFLEKRRPDFKGR